MMELPALSPVGFLSAIVFAGIVLLLCIYIPVQLAAKWRRVRSLRTRITCRICGYRFMRADVACHCPHCGARNR